jgi:hypothetical protein
MDVQEHSVGGPRVEFATVDSRGAEYSLSGAVFVTEDFSPNSKSYQ